jgi:hypothetical protein
MYLGTHNPGVLGVEGVVQQSHHSPRVLGVEGIVYEAGDAQSRGSWWEGCVIVGAIYSIPKIRSRVGGSGSLFWSTVPIGRRCSADRNMIG